MEHSSASRIFLTGMMGAGKTCVGRRLAQALGWGFVDLDEAIEAQSGQSVASIFAREGEDGFRQLEQRQLLALLDGPDQANKHLVVALGGGTYVQKGVSERLRERGPTVLLEVPVETLVERALGQGLDRRPLVAQIDPGGALRRLWNERSAAYRQADVTVDADAPPAEVVARILTSVGSQTGMAPWRAMKVSLGQRSYPIWIDSGGAGAVAGLIRLRIETTGQVPGRVMVVTDTRVAGLHLKELVKALEAQGDWSINTIVVPEGEGAKSVEHLSRVWTQLLEAGVTRRDVVVAFGGGVVGDLAGFAAATIMRGVRLIQVPTTVLAQVDSSVGGKTGINHPRGKNLIGAFYQPIGVVMGQRLLKTLEPRQTSSGLAEVVKYAVLDGEPLLEMLEANAEALVAAPWGAMDLVARCCAIKARIVAQDEREAGIRATLNLGHTFGHAIEAMEDFKGVTHGEAVGLGMVLAARAAHRWLDAPPGLEVRLTQLLERLNLPTDVSKYLAEAGPMAKLMQLDKKATSDAVVFILPVTVGKVVSHRVGLGVLQEALETLA